MPKPWINTDEPVAGAIFEELGKHNDDAEMEFLREKYLDSKGYRRRGQEGILILDSGILKTS